MTPRVALALAGAAIVVAAPSALTSRTQLPLEPMKDAGLGVTAAYEGWFRHADGSVSLLIGYFNRNLKQLLDIPIGPENRIEPGGPDQGQPTHFLPRRQWGMFTIPVPKDFGDRKLTWTLVANGQTASVTMGLNPLYEVEPFKEAAQGNTPPVLRFERSGPAFQGPPRGIAATLHGVVGQPVALALWATDDGIVDSNRRAPESPVTVKWARYRGPGEVSFRDAAPKVDKADGSATTAATFSAPGDYILRAQGNDVSGEGGSGFQCCWTSTHVKVIVKPVTTSR
ncbi:MAG: hypothetical protein ACRD26_04795 [Vicinamibacterales bacterium]